MKPEDPKLPTWVSVALGGYCVGLGLEIMISAIARAEAREAAARARIDARASAASYVQAHEATYEHERPRPAAVDEPVAED